MLLSSETFEALIAFLIKAKLQRLLRILHSYFNLHSCMMVRLGLGARARD